MPRFLASILATLVLSVLGPDRALAAAMPPAPTPIPLPSVLIEGPAQVDERRVSVRCREIGEDAYSCDVEVAFRLTASEPVVLRRLGDASWSVTGDDLEERSRDEVDLAALPRIDPATGEPLESSDEPRILEVTLRFARSVSIGTVDREDFLIMAPLRGRHLLLGDGGAVRREGSSVYGELISGTELTVVGELSASVEAPDAVAVNIAGHSVDGSMRVPVPHSALILATVPEPEGEPPVIQHGGPVLAAGVRLDFSEGDSSRFLLRGAYELAVEGHFIGSISFETDFESIYESLVIEAASPSLLILLPSVSAGVGFVARQLGNRDADAGLRLRVGMNFIAVGVTCDFDYWPTIGDWTGMVVGRISI